MSNGSQRSLLSRLENGLERLERRKWLLLLLFLILYFAGFCLLAAKDVTFIDELFTIYITRLPTLRDVWNALATGAEQTPPLIYLVTRADFALLGRSLLAVRLPEMLGFAVMSVCLYHFVSKRSSALYGLVAMLFPLMTTAFKFVVRARAYALVLGFSALALVCWQWAAEDRHRKLALAGLGVSLAAAVSSHYYAVLSLFPLGLGEVVRSIRRKKVDVGVWLALVLSLSPLLLFLPLIESARKFAPHFWSKPHWSSMAYFYQHFLLSPSPIPLLAILLVVAFYVVFFRPNAGGTESRARSNTPLHEWAAVAGFLLMPLVGIVLAKTVVGAYEDRCALAAVIGLSIAVALGLYSALDTKLTPAFGLALLLCSFLVVKQVQTYRREVVYHANQESVYALLEANTGDSLPILISNPGAFVVFGYNAPKKIARRFLYVADPELALHYSGTDDIEQGVVEMKSWAGMNVQSFPKFVASGQECYIYAVNYPDRYDWIIKALRAAHWEITLVSWQNDNIIFLARPGGRGRVPAGPISQVK